MDKKFLEAFIREIRKQIAQKNEVSVSRLGTFRFNHQKQFQQQYDDGRVVMMPPKDTIEFIPEEERS